MSEISFGEAAKIVAGTQRSNISDNLFRQIEKVHDLGDTRARNAFVCGYFRHGEGIVGIKHRTPFKGDLNRISGGLSVSRGCLMTAVQVRQTVDGEGNWMDNRRPCTPSGKGHGHDGGRQLEVRMRLWSAEPISLLPIGMVLRSVGLWTLLIILVGCLLSNLAWDSWLAHQTERDRNPLRVRGWREFVAGTEPCRENETVILLLSNSQGYGREVDSSLTYGQQFECIRRNAGCPVRVVNWCIAGIKYNEMITLAAAAQRLKPSAILVVLSARTFKATDLRGKAISRWASDVYYLLGDPAIRQRIPEQLRPGMVDLSLQTDILVGSIWPAWRARAFPIEFLRRSTPLRGFLDPTTTVVRTGRNAPRRPVVNPSTAAAVPAVDVSLVNAFLDVVCSSAPSVYMVNMPLRSGHRARERTPWMPVEQACQGRRVHTYDLSDQVPDEGFMDDRHFNARGHRLMAEKLNEVLP